MKNKKLKYNWYYVCYESTLMSGQQLVYVRANRKSFSLLNEIKFYISEFIVEKLANTEYKCESVEETIRILSLFKLGKDNKKNRGLAGYEGNIVLDFDDITSRLNGYEDNDNEELQ